MPANPPAPNPDPTTREHLARLDEAMEALARGLVRLLADLDSAPTSLDPADDAGLSVPVGERRLSVSTDAAGTSGRSA